MADIFFLTYQISCIQRNYMSLLLEEKNVRQAIKISPHLKQQQRQHEITTEGKEKKHQQHVHSDCIVPNLFNSFFFIKYMFLYYTLNISAKVSEP